MATAPTGGGNPLVRQYGALKGWQWVAVIGAAGSVYLYLRSRNSAAATTATSATTGQALDAYGNPIPGQQILTPIIIQQGGGSTGPKGPPGPPGPPGPVKPPPKKQPAPTPKFHSGDYSQSIAANSSAGKGMVALGTVQNGKYTGKNSNSGAPVYALIDTGYGPKTSFVQDFNLAKLPNGTKLYTLPEFAKYFK